MLPFVFIDPTRLGPVQPWGFFLALGFLVGDACWMRRAKLLGYDTKSFRAYVIWLMVMGFFLSHVLDEIFYHPDEIARRPWSLFFVWEGLSSLGGFIGALVGGLGWKYLDVHWRGPLPFLSPRPRPLPLLPFADVSAATFPVGWVFGRLGCALVHDHPGALARAGAFLSVAWPLSAEDGLHHTFGPIHAVYGSTARYDLGLLEFLFSVVLASALVMTWERRLPIGTYLCATALAYSPVRFFMDFLRARDDVPGGDLRQGGLTFAQWICIAFFLVGLGMAWRLLRPTRLRAMRV